MTLRYILGENDMAVKLAAQDVYTPYEIIHLLYPFALLDILQPI